MIELTEYFSNAMQQLTTNVITIYLLIGLLFIIPEIIFKLLGKLFKKLF